SWFTPERLAELVEAETGRSIELDPEQLMATLDPRGSVQNRHVSGGPALESTNSQLLEASRRLTEDTSWLDRRNAEQIEAGNLLARLATGPESSQEVENP